jgi:hypothetical protein
MQYWMVYLTILHVVGHLAGLGRSDNLLSTEASAAVIYGEAWPLRYVTGVARPDWVTVTYTHRGHGTGMRVTYTLPAMHVCAALFEALP